MAAERPRHLLRKHAPYGLYMDGSSDAQMRAILATYQMNVSQPISCNHHSCAVVGSAGNLRGSGLGAAIDAHDAVFRINAAPVILHAADVGIRTTWRIHNSEKPYFMASLDVPELQVNICHMQWIGSCQSQAWSGAYSDTVAYVNPVFYSELWSLLGRRKHAPSTGLLAIALALRTCDSVSVFGFSVRGEPDTCRGHYWERPNCRHQSYTSANHPFHDWPTEQKLRAHWHASGLFTNGSSAPVSLSARRG